LEEVATHCETGLALLQALPDDDERAELELDLRNAGMFALAFARGTASSEYLQSSARALALCERPKINWEKAWLALYSTCIAELNRDLRKSCEIAAELLARAEAHASASHIAAATVQLASLRLVGGNFELAAEGTKEERHCSSRQLSYRSPFHGRFGAPFASPTLD
jgi:hypothetical protein